MQAEGELNSHTQRDQVVPPACSCAGIPAQGSDPLSFLEIARNYSHLKSSSFTNNQ